MERILTNYQVEWLVNIKLLLEYSDASFEIYENVKKIYNFIENEYPGEEDNIIEELKVLKEKEFINLDVSQEGYIDNAEITKKGLDYLVILEEHAIERTMNNEKIDKVYTLLCDMHKQNINMNRKTLLEKIEQITSISNNTLTTVSYIGSICQGLLPGVIRIINNF